VTIFGGCKPGELARSSGFDARANQSDVGFRGAKRTGIDLGDFGAA